MRLMSRCFCSLALTIVFRVTSQRVIADSGFLAPANRDNRLDGRASHQGARRGQYQGLLQHGKAN